MQSKIYLDVETQEPIDVLRERNERVKESIDDILQEFITQRDSDKSGRKKFGFQLLMQIENELGNYGLMNSQDFDALTADDIDYYWRSFHSLMAYYNRFFEIVPNRQTFMLYMGINSRMYKKLVNGGDREDNDIKELILFIDDNLVGKGFAAGENGNADAKAVASRLRAKDVGHDVISAVEEKALEQPVLLSPAEMKRQLNAKLDRMKLE